MMAVLGVFVGGALGGVIRYGCTRWLGSAPGVLVANLIACFVLALATGMSFHPVLVGTGFAGALSTWSTLSKEIGLMVKACQWRRLAWYAAAHVGGGLLAVTWGLRVAATL